MKNIYIIVGAIVLALGGVLFYLNGDTSLSERNDKPTVITSFYPLQYFVSEIVGDTMNVVNIGRNNDPHDFTPSAKDIVSMQEAALVVLQGAGLETWSEDVEHQLEDVGVPVFVATEHVALLELGEEGHADEEHKDEHRHDEHKDEHADEHGHDGHEDLPAPGAARQAGEHHHAHGSHDPHTWLDPVLAAETVEHLTEELIEVNPVYEDLYNENANALIEAFTALDGEYRATLTASSCTADEALVSHDAFGYLADRYDLEMHPIVGISTKDEPSAKLLAKLKEEAEVGVLAVLTEESSVKEYAETIARETGIKIVPISALATDSSINGGDYLDGLQDNLEGLIQAYGCTG